MLAMNTGCLSIIAALLTVSNENKTVTVLSFTVPIALLLMVGYAVVLLFQGHTHLHLTHIARLSASGVSRDRLTASPVIAMHAGHGKDGLDSYLSGVFLFTQILFLPVMTGCMVASLSAAVALSSPSISLRSRMLYLFPMVMLAVTVLTAWRSHKLFRSLCKQVDTHGPGVTNASKMRK